MHKILPLTLAVVSATVFGAETELESCLALADTERLACYDEKVKAAQKRRLQAERQEPAIATMNTGESQDSQQNTGAEAALIPVATILQSLWSWMTVIKEGPSGSEPINPTLFCRCITAVR